MSDPWYAKTKADPAAWRAYLDRQAAAQRRRYAERKRAGLCAQGACRREAEPGAAYCPGCLLWRNAITFRLKRQARPKSGAAGPAAG